MNNLLQAGGHQLIKSNGTSIIKPTRQTEVEFYKNYLPKYPELHNFLPKFYNSGLIEEKKALFTDDEYKIIIEKKYNYYIELENLLDGFENNTYIFDIKLGSIHWKKDTPEKEIESCKLRNKNSTTGKYGFRLDGVIIDNNKYTKDHCRNMSIDKIIDVLSLMENAQIEKIKVWIKNLSNIIGKINLNLYGPSLLIIISNNNMKIKLIDFTVFDELSIDNEDLIESLQNLNDTLTYVQLKKEQLMIKN